MLGLKSNEMISATQLLLKNKILQPVFNFGPFKTLYLYKIKKITHNPDSFQQLSIF